jgi:hypothetical protein
MLVVLRPHHQVVGGGEDRAVDDEDEDDPHPTRKGKPSSAVATVDSQDSEPGFVGGSALYSSVVVYRCRRGQWIELERGMQGLCDSSRDLGILNLFRL